MLRDRNRHGKEACGRQRFPFFTVKVTWLDVNSTSHTYAAAPVLPLNKICSPLPPSPDKILFTPQIVAHLLNALTFLKYFREKQLNSVYVFIYLYMYLFICIWIYLFSYILIYSHTYLFILIRIYLSSHVFITIYIELSLQLTVSDAWGLPSLSPTVGRSGGPRGQKGGARCRCCPRRQEGLGVSPPRGVPPPSAPSPHWGSAGRFSTYRSPNARYDRRPPPRCARAWGLTWALACWLSCKSVPLAPAEVMTHVSNGAAPSSSTPAVFTAGAERSPTAHPERTAMWNTQ